MMMEDKRIGIVVSRFNEDITQSLLQGAYKAAAQNGILEEELDVIWVPGAFELPLVAKKMAQTRKYDAILCLGAVLQGETKHFDVVCSGAAIGVTQAALDTGIPILFGVLTCNRAQALARTSPQRNKGYDTFMAALDMIDVCSQIEPKTEKLLH